jgi:hypothetical protein
MKVLRRIPNLVGIAVVSLCLSVVAFAQVSPSPQPVGRVKGQVVDLIGAVVANARVVFANAEVNRTAVSNQDGDFEIELPAGEYRVTVAPNGFYYPFERKKLKVRAARVKKFTVILNYDIKKHPPII